jgi:5-hydroxyisourate hydrolase
MPALSGERQAVERVEALLSHLGSLPSTSNSTVATQPSQPSPVMSADKRPPITCHVLDTTIGKPGANIPVTLTLLNKGVSESLNVESFTATTNSDGRVTGWKSTDTHFQSIEEVFQSAGLDTQKPLRWALRFDTEAYFGQRGITAFFPEVEVRFLVGGGGGRNEHYHVPVLLGPFGFTTYRGS